MKFAIISAGEESRLSQEGVALPKPLVQLNGVAMIDRLIRILSVMGLIRWSLLLIMRVR